MENIASGSSNANINIDENQTFDIIDVDQSVIIYNNDNVPMNQLTDKRIKSKVNYSFHFHINYIDIIY